MATPFNVLRKKMTRAAQKKAQEKAQAMLQELAILETTRQPDVQKQETPQRIPHQPPVLSPSVR